MIRPWLNQLQRRFFPISRRARRAGLKILPSRLRLEPLEDRWVPSLTVSNTNDSGAGSLRQAILSANSSPGSEIVFSIGSGGLATIIPASALPTITAAGTTIDGTTQPGHNNSPLIVLEGANSGQVSYDGLTITGANCTIRGLVINSFSNGITIENSNATGDIVTGCYIGTNSSGTAAQPNSNYGVVVDGADDTIGGTVTGAGNVVSGNGKAGIDVISAGNLVEGNICGLDFSGTNAVPNQTEGISVQGGATGNTIGGTATGAGNICSGNGRDGLYISDSGTTGNMALGNIIGLNKAENGRVQNGLDGVLIRAGAHGNTLGTGNIIGGNHDNGVHITDANTSNNSVQGCYIGTTPSNFTSTSSIDLGDRKRGIFIDSAAGNLIGGLTNTPGTGLGNIICSNGMTASGKCGIVIANINSNDNVVEGNFIADNTFCGVRIGDKAQDNTIGGTVVGAGNLIGINGSDGVRVDAENQQGNISNPGYNNAILGNSITENPTGNNGIYLTEGGNNNAVSPVLISAVGSATSITVTGTLTGAAGTYYNLEFFASAAVSPPEGQTYLNWNPNLHPGQDFQVHIDSTGFVNFTVTLNPMTAVSPGQYITATATAIDSSGQPEETSQFSSGISAQVDNILPTSSVNALPHYSPTTFTVSYTASDPGSNASGLAEVDVYVKGPTDNGYNLAHAFTGSSLSSGSFSYNANEGDGSYAFYSIATDSVGNVQATPSSANTTTLLDTAKPTSSVSSQTSSNSTSFTVNYTASDPGSNASGLAEVDIYVKGPSDSGYKLVHAFTVSSLSSGRISYNANEGDGSYAFYSIATDKAGNVQTVPSVANTTTLLDTAKPTSTASSPTSSTSTGFTVNYTASDLGSSASGLSEVDVYVEGPTDNGYGLAHAFTGSGLGSGNFNYNASEGDGTYAFYSIATDKAGNVQTTPSIANTTTLLDTVKPTSSVSSPTSSSSTTFTVSYTANDPGSSASGLSEVDVYVEGPTDGGYRLAHAFTGSGLGSGNFNYTANEGDGTYAFYSIATDKAGNAQTVPSVANATTLLEATSTASSPQYSNSTTFTVSYTASDPGGSANGLTEVDVYVKGPTDSSYRLAHAFTGSGLGSGNFSYTASEGDGTYAFYSIATDSVGNIQDIPSVANTTTLLDTAKPTSSVSSPTSSSSTTFTVSYTASDPGSNASGLAEVDIYVKGPTDSSYSLAHAFTDSSLNTDNFSYNANEGDGSYAFYSIVTDKAGNVQTTPSIANTTTLLDTAKPTSSVSSPTSSSSTTFTVSYTASDSGNSASGLSEVDVYVKGPTDSSYSLAHAFTDSSLNTDNFSYNANEGDGSYAFYSIATDKAGNVQTTPSIANTTTLLDTVKPTSSVSSPTSSSSTTFTVSYTANDPGSSASGLSEVDVYVKGPTDSSYSLAHAFTGSGLSTGNFNYTANEGDGTYAFYSIATDKAGNAETTSSAQTSTLLDTVKPTSSVKSPTTSTSTTFTVNYTASDAGSSASGLSEVDVYVEGPTDGGYSLAHAFTDSSLSSGNFSYTANEGDGTYAFYSIATDKAGNAETTSSAQTSTLLDTAQPTSSVNSPTSSTSTTFTVSCTASDPGSSASGLSEVDVYVKGPTDSSYSLAHAFTDSSLNTDNFSYNANEGDGSYAFYSIVTDKAGNVQTTPSIANTTTLLDTAKPTSSVSSPTSSSSTTFTVSDPGSSASGLSEVDVYVEGPTDSSYSLIHTFTGPSVGSGNFSYTASEGDGIYAFYSVATDNVGNVQPAPTTAQATTTVDQYSLSNSFVTTSLPSVQSGSTSTITLQAEDAAGNKETSGGLTVAFALGSISGAQGTIGPVTDNGDGTYTATFTGIIAGSNTITATIGGQAVTSTAPAITVTPGPVNLAKSIVRLSTPSIQLGGVATITLQAKDVNGNDETSGGLSIAFALGSTTDAKGTLSSVTDNHNGTYTATFTGTLDGSNTITATINGSPVTSTAPGIAVTGAAVSVAKSTLKLSPATIQSGTSTTITLQAEDAKGNDETSGGLTVAFKLGTTAGSQGTFSPVTDNGNGTYTATFTGTIAGINTIRATIDGHAVATVAPAIRVTPGAVSLAKSVVTLSASSVRSNSAITLTLHAKDAAGNNETTGGLTVLFSLENLSGGQGTFSNNVKDNKNGTYTATFTGTMVGVNAIAATIGGQAVTSTAPAITVKPGPVSFAKSFVTVLSGSIQSGSTTTVTLQAEDAHGNLETTGGWAVVFELGSVGGGRGTFTPAKNNKNGTYTATFAGTIAGSNTITATISGMKITSTAPAITVTPGPVSLAKSVVTLSANSVKSGSTITATLQAKDAAGNKETTGGLTVAFALGSISGGQGTLTSFSDNGNGTYTAIFTGTITGKNTIRATIDGEDLTSTTPSIAIV